MLRKRYDIMRIPAELKGMTLREVQKSWHGNLNDTVAKMSRDVMEREEREKVEREEKERREQEGAKRYVCHCVFNRIADRRGWLLVVHATGTWSISGTHKRRRASNHKLRNRQRRGPPGEC
jgi:hypothetical protein